MSTPRSEPVASPEVAPRSRRFPRASWGVIAWLTLVWLLLWGTPTVANAVTGLLVALLVTTAMPLPHSPFDPRFRPLGVAHLAARFLLDVTVASVQVAWLAISGRQPQGAVIRVHLRSHSDTVLATTAGMASLVPGSIVIEAHRLTGTLYVHVFDVGIVGGLDQAHRNVLDQEERILRAVGSPDQLIDAGFRPGALPRAGRLPDGEAAP